MISGEGGMDPKRPLGGVRILITRAQAQSRSLAKKIRDLGGEPIYFPVIRIIPPRNPEPLDAALDRLSSFDWLAFTSVNGVKHFFRRMDERGLDTRPLRKIRIAAVGPKTAEALEERKLSPLIVPEENRAEALAAAMAPAVQPGEEILFPRGNLARNVLVEELEWIGCRVTDVIVYENRPRREGAGKIVRLLKAGRVDIVTFTSSSTVRNFVIAVGSVEPDWKPLLEKVKVACIGPVTANTATEAGITVDAVAEPYTMEGLIRALVELTGR